MEKKMKLEELEVKSFVTTVSKSETETVKGGLFSLFWCDEEETQRCSQSCYPITERYECG